MVTGVASSGRSTVAAILADRLNCSLSEGEDFHPAGNITEMAAGHALTGEPQWAWLEAIRDWITANPGDAVITCSALRRSYRDFLRTADAQIRFLHIHGTVQELAAQLSGSTAPLHVGRHAGFATCHLEPLDADENGAVLHLGDTPHMIAERAAHALTLEAS